MNGNLHMDRKDAAMRLSFRPVALPLVIVEGFLSATNAFTWPPIQRILTGYEKYLTDRRVFVASVGPVSSLHDRACELYYAIKGGTVDYGVVHSHTHRHKRYGRDGLRGIYPEWSSKNPLHFLGHSIGGATIVKLQDLLSKGFFGPDCDADMILSMTSVSTPFRGTQLVYALGERTDCAPSVRSLSIGSLLGKAAHIIAYVSPFLPSAMDLHIHSRSLSFKDLSFPSFLKHLWRSDWVEGKDATPFDVTFQASDEREASGEGHCYPRTYYRSYVAQISEDSLLSADMRNPFIYLLIYSANIISSFDLSSLKPFPSFLKYSPVKSNLEKGQEEARGRGTTDVHRNNDGVVPIFSQWHPHDCEATNCVHHDLEEKDSQLEPGVWHVHTAYDAHHFSVLPFWNGSDQQLKFWKELDAFMRRVELYAVQTRSQAQAFATID